MKVGAKQTGIKEEPCPKCGGAGWWVDYVPSRYSYGDEYSDNYNLEQIQVQCTECQATGVVPVEVD